MPTTFSASLWSHRHKQWLRHLERTSAPTFGFERSHGPRLRKLPDWSRALPAAASTGEWKPPVAR